MLAERGAAVVLGARRTERLDKLARRSATVADAPSPDDAEISNLTIRPTVQG